MAKRVEEPFYPHELKPFGNTVIGEGWTGDGDRTRLITAVQVATRSRKGGRNTFVEGVHATDLTGMDVYISHEMGLTPEGRPQVRTGREGQWIVSTDYENIKSK